MRSPPDWDILAAGDRHPALLALRVLQGGPGVREGSHIQAGKAAIGRIQGTR